MNETMNKTVKKSTKRKIVIKDKTKFFKAIGIVAIVFLLLIVIIVSSGKKTIDDSTNIMELKTKKYAKEIKAYYETEGKIEEFINSYNNVQNQAWMYIYNNVSGDKTQEDLVKEVNEVLKTNDWSSINVEQNTKWKGTFYIDTESNTMKFKFEKSSIEPSWIEDSTVSSYIEKN